MTQWLGVIVRFIVSALVLIVVSWLSPGFVVRGGFVGALIAAVVIAVLGYIVEACWATGFRPRAGV